MQLMESGSPFSLAVFEDLVYWSDTRRRTIQGALKVTGKQQLVLLKRLSQPLGVKGSTISEFSLMSSRPSIPRF